MKLDLLFAYLFLLLLIFLLVIGSTTALNNVSIVVAIVCSLFLTGLLLIAKKDITIPKNFALYLLFLTVLLIHTLMYKGEVLYSFIFFTGGVLWFLGYNLRNFFSKYYLTIIILLGLLLFGLFIISHLYGFFYLGTNESLILPLSAKTLHNHLGDLWAIILVALIYLSISDFKPWAIPLALIALFLIATSFSRSAVLSLLVGASYVLYKTPLFRKKKVFFVVLFVSVATLSIYFSLFKTTLFSRPYYIEALASFISSPLGIGVGNFSQVSTETSLTHDLILELVAGMGIFSFIFIYWMYKIIKSFGDKATNLLYKALFLAMFVNFSFDSTYVVPTMIWIWFTALALIHN